MNGRTAKAIRREARKAMSDRPRGGGEVFGVALDKWAETADNRVTFKVRRHALRRKRTVVVIFRAVPRG